MQNVRLNNTGIELRFACIDLKLVLKDGGLQSWQLAIWLSNHFIQFSDVKA